MNYVYILYLYLHLTILNPHISHICNRFSIFDTECLGGAGLIGNNPAFQYCQYVALRENESTPKMCNLNNVAVCSSLLCTFRACV